MPLLRQPSILLAFFASAAHCSLTLSLLSDWTPRSFYTELLPLWVDPSLCCTPEFCFPQCKTLYLSLLNFIRFLLAHSSSLSRSSCRVTYPSKVSSSPLSLLLLANFIRVYLILSSRSLKKILNSTGPNTNPWGTPLVTDCQFEKELFTTTLWVKSVSQFPTHRIDHLSRP